MATSTLTTGSFTAVNDTITHPLMKKGETVVVAISGTYVQKIELQRATTSAKLAWETLKIFNTANQTEAFAWTVQRDEEILRLLLRTDTSGTAVVSLRDGDQSLHTVKDKQGGTVYEVKQSGMVIGGVKVSEFLALDPGRKLTFMEDFIAPISTKWSTAGAGSGSGNQVLTIVANGIGGEATMESASDDGTHAANLTCLSFDALSFKASQGNLVIEARLKVDDIANGAYIFVGFDDTIDTTSKAPLFFTADAIDSDSTDAAGVLYDFDSTTDKWAVGGVKNTTDTSPIFAASVPVVNTYATVRVEINSDGVVTGYIDGTLIGSVAAAITTTVALTPYIAVGNRSANQVIMTLDYVYVQQDR